MFYGTVDTSQYEASHGKAPRGRGSWAFEFDGGEPEWCPGSCTYGEARKWAIKQGRARMSSSVVVCP